MSFQDIHTLPKGATFIGPSGSRYKVTTSAADDPNGFVQVWNLSMSDTDVTRLLDTPGAVERDCDPREGVFNFPPGFEVEVLDSAVTR